MSVHVAHLDLDDAAAELHAPLFKLNVTGRKRNDTFLHVYFIIYTYTYIHIYIHTHKCIFFFRKIIKLNSKIPQYLHIEVHGHFE